MSKSNWSKGSLALAALCGLTPSGAQAAVLVNLDATGLPEGSSVSTWTNSASLAGNFALTAGGTAPKVAALNSVKGIKLDGTGNFVGPVAPAGITAAGTRTIEAWVYNPSGSDHEVIVAWGRRGGGPDNSNNSFSHGVHPTWGAMGGWGAGDLDWAGKEKFNTWNYIVYTYDGTSSTVYSDGELANSEDLTMATYALDTASRPLPIRVGAQNNADGTIFNGEPPTMTVGRIRIHDTALTAEEISAKYLAERADFGFNDDDNDGLPNGYEKQFAFLNPNDPTDAAKDQDGDGLTNLQEFLIKTRPDLADTDGDGASDGAEVNRKFDGVSKPTDPLNPDSDGDGLPDGAETSTGVYVSATNTGSDPTLGDTDGDTFPDGQEVVHGSNPNSAASVPVFTQPVVSLDATSLSAGPINNWTNTGFLGGVFAASGAPTVTILQGVKGVTLDGVADYLTGPAAPPYVAGSNSHSVEAWIFNPAAADEETIFSWGRRGGPDGSNVSFNHGLNASFGAVGHWGGPDIGWDGKVVQGRWTYVVYTWNDGDRLDSVYSDGEVAATETVDAGFNVWSVDTSNNPLPFRVGSQNDASGFPTTGLRGSMTIARVRVHDRALTAAEITAKYAAEADEFGLVDRDNDGLPTWFEKQYPGILNPDDATDAAKDFDNDGLTNLQEFQLGTAVDKADTDGDGLKDGAEVNHLPAPTNPLVADTDQDGIPDGAETTTDPTVADSDGDGFPDGQELLHGSNPLLATSVPDLTKPVAIVDLKVSGLADGPLASWTNSGALGGSFISGPNVAAVTSSNVVKAVNFEGNNFYTGVIAPAYVAGNSGRSVDAWIYNPAADTEETLISWGHRGGPDGSNASFIHGTNPSFGAMGQWGGYDVGWSNNVIQGRWTHVAYTYDPATSTAHVYADAVEATSALMPGPLTTYLTYASDRQVPFRVGIQNAASGDIEGQFANLQIARLRVYDAPLAAEAITKLFNDEKAAYAPSALKFAQPLIDSGNGKITLSWSGVTAASYRLEASDDLKTWAPAATGLTAPTYVIDQPSAKAAQFYRVRPE